MPRETPREAESAALARRADDTLARAPLGDEAAQAVAPRAAAELAGKKALVVDDDIRNVFALTSALEAHGLQVLHAESGKEGIELLKRTPDIDLILMDVMMPGLDGLDTMRIIRQLEGFQSLPIVAVTAKAMMGDRDKCIDAGATDYVAKPVNIDVLLATLWRTLPQEAPHG
jgi:CheY-like chemotaxis protein